MENEDIFEKVERLSDEYFDVMARRMELEKEINSLEKRKYENTNS